MERPGEGEQTMGIRKRFMLTLLGGGVHTPQRHTHPSIEGCSAVFGVLSCCTQQESAENADQH